MSYKHYLLLRRIEIQGANAISSPLTYGFPAITGFLGAIHALNRALKPTFDVDMTGVLIASHRCAVQRYRPHSYADYTFNQSRNPIKRNGGTAAIVEEGKAHLTVSLAVELSAEREVTLELKNNPAAFQEAVHNQLIRQRICGGSVFRIASVETTRSSDELKRGLLPAFVLNDAGAELIDITASLRESNPEATPLDALIEVATLHHLPPEKESGETDWRTTSAKTGRGWLTPIPVGYQSIAEPFKAGELPHSRAANYPSEYVESLYSLGKWEFPHRIADITNSFWRYANPGNGLYLVTQTNPSN
jgi:CRISPR-associated protein Csy2